MAIHTIVLVKHTTTVVAKRTVEGVTVHTTKVIGRITTREVIIHITKEDISLVNHITVEASAASITSKVQVATARQLWVVKLLQHLRQRV